MSNWTKELVRLGLGTQTAAQLETAYGGSAVKGQLYWATDKYSYLIGQSDGSLSDAIMTKFSIYDDVNGELEIKQLDSIKFKASSLLKTEWLNTNELTTKFDLTGGSAYQVTRINSSATDVEWAAPVSVHPDSSSLLSIDSQNRIKAEALLVMNRTIDETETSLSNWITSSSYTSTDDIDILVLTNVSDGNGGQKLEMYLQKQTGRDGTASDFVKASVDVTDAYVLALFSAGEGITKSSGQFSLEYFRKTSNLPEFYNGTSWLEVFTSGNIDTGDVSEGTSLYYTQARFNTAFGAKTTDDLTVGTSNLYWTQSLFDTAFGGESTTNLSEGTNLYYTQSRANTAIDARVTTAFIDALDVDADTLDGQDGSYYLNPSNQSWSLSNGYLPYFDGSDLSDSFIYRRNSDGVRLGSYIHVGQRDSNTGVISSNYYFNGTDFSKTHAGGIYAGGWLIDNKGGGYGDFIIRSEKFGTDASTVANTAIPLRFKIDAETGNVGINTSSPSVQLDVNGSIKGANIYGGAGIPYTLNGVTLDTGIGKITGGTNSATYRNLLDLSYSATKANAAFLFPNSTFIQFQEDGANETRLISNANTFFQIENTGDIYFERNNALQAKVTNGFFEVENNLKINGLTGSKYLYLNSSKQVTEKTIADLQNEILGASNTANIISVNQTTHGFSLGGMVYWGGTEWDGSQADTHSNVKFSVGVVIESVDDDNFKIATSGVWTITSHGFTVGSNYAVSTGTAGAVVDASTLDEGSDIIWLAFTVIDANRILIQNKKYLS
ncbi:MAG: hypothetical protein ACPGFK_00605 [Flavobacteriaceae bacterium]